jgi:hypothetical protein
MFDSPHPPRVFERLLDSEQAAAIIKVHPKTLQRYARHWHSGRPARRQALALPRFRSDSSAPRKRRERPRRRRPGTLR